MIATSCVSTKGKVRKYFSCFASYELGHDCPNRHLLPYDRITQAVLEPFEEMEPDVLSRMLDAELARMGEEYDAQWGSLDALKAEVARLDAELGRLAEAWQWAASSRPF